MIRLLPFILLTACQSPREAELMRIYSAVADKMQVSPMEINRVEYVKADKVGWSGYEQQASQMVDPSLRRCREFAAKTKEALDNASIPAKTIRFDGEGWNWNANTTYRHEVTVTDDGWVFDIEAGYIYHIEGI